MIAAACIINFSLKSQMSNKSPIIKVFKTSVQRIYMYRS